MTRSRILARGAALTAALLLATACSDDEGTAPTVTLLVEAVFGPPSGTVTVSDGGVPVEGASVDVNGVAAVAGGVPGEYGLAFAVPVAGGATITVEVSDAGAVVLAEATVPHTPVLTAPAQDAVFANTQDIEVTWTSTSDPDRWVVEASDGTVETFDVADGAARAFTIPGGTLTADTWEIRVIAYNDGVVSGDIEAGSAMEVQAAVATSPTVIVVEPVRVLAIAFSGAGGAIAITVEGVVVDGAAVAVNGVPAVQNAPGGNYQVTLDPAVAPGGNIELSVEFGNVSIEGLAIVPEAPVVTAPVDGAELPLDAPFDVTWTSTADASNGWLAVLDDGVNSAGMPNTEPTARSLTFPALLVDLDPGPYLLTVYAFNAGELSGPVSANSAMNIRNENAVKPEVTLTP